MRLIVLRMRSARNSAVHAYVLMFNHVHLLVGSEQLKDQLEAALC